MKSASDAWKENLEIKVVELRELLVRYITVKEDKLAEELSGRLTGLKMMFGEPHVPEVLKHLERALKQFHQNRNHAPYLLELINGFNALPSVAAFTEVEPLSFDKIFESYKEDEALNSLVKELVGLLERILLEGDEILSAQVARELQIILDQLKRRDRQSLYELQNWIDLGMRALIMATETYTGTKGISLLYEAAKIAYKIKVNLLTHYVDAQRKLVEEYKLAYVQQAMDKVPELTSDEQARKFLNPPA